MICGQSTNVQIKKGKKGALIPRGSPLRRHSPPHPTPSVSPPVTGNGGAKEDFFFQLTFISLNLSYIIKPSPSSVVNFARPFGISHASKCSIFCPLRLCGALGNGRGVSSKRGMWEGGEVLDFGHFDFKLGFPGACDVCISAKVAMLPRERQRETDLLLTLAGNKFLLPPTQNEPVEN